MAHNNRYTHDWTEARIKRLVELWEGGFSASECARKLGGISRNSVIGKIHRLGLSNMERPQRENLRQHIVSVIKRKAKMRGTNETVVGQSTPRNLTSQHLARGTNETVVGQPRVVTLLELRPGMCRYPQGDHVPYTFCGAPKVEGSSYCETHRRLTMTHGRAA